MDIHEAILDTLDDQIVRYRSRDRVITYANRAFLRAHVSPGAEAVGRPLDDVVQPGTLAAAWRGESVDAEDRAISWARHAIVPSDDDEGDVLAVGRDVTAHREAQAQVEQSEARFRELADRSADVVFRFVMGPVPHFSYMSPSVEKLIGYRPEDLHDLDAFLAIVREEDATMVRAVVAGARMPDRYDMHLERPDGSTVIAELQVTLLADGLLGVARDVTQVRALQAELAELALRDPLTGLANRRLLDEVLALALSRSARAGEPLAVAVLDLDGLKWVNDTYGHDAGDAVLVETAHRLSSTIRDADVVARTGGDEFVIVHGAVGPEADALVERLAAALSEPIELPTGVVVTCAPSIGIVGTDTVGHDAGALLAGADAAMYQIKRTRAARMS